MSKHPLRAYAFIYAMTFLCGILIISLGVHARLNAKPSVVVDLCALGFFLSLWCGLPRE
jgi:hypothetical protein